jgi:16S rRNA (cytosine1402-N4)-methyltransferase
MSWLRLQSGRAYIDATVGLGGHARGILEGSSPDGRLLALDVDPEGLRYAQDRLAEFAARVVFARGRHVDLAAIARRNGFAQVDGILLDLGVSSLQLDDPKRGFSFQKEGPLDMRMGPADAGVTAEEIVNSWPEKELSRIIYEYGEERHARRIARAICAQRPLHSTRELADLVAGIVGYRGRIHPATRTFQGIRLAVNQELTSLEAVLPQAVELLSSEGRLVVIAFHSLEDRIVKRFIVRESKDCICPPGIPQCVCGHTASLKRLTKKPIRPTEQEVSRNRRSKSARMRVAEKKLLKREDRDVS